MKLLLCVAFLLLGTVVYSPLSATEYATPASSSIEKMEVVVTPAATIATISKAEVLEATAGIFRKCKWAQQTCPGGGTVEHCLTSGDGNNCRCGTTTRPCSASS